MMGKSGFTLVEVMIAGSLGTLLSLVLFQMIIQTGQMADTMIMQSTLNSQARELFELLMDGGVRPGGTLATPADRIPGYHGRSTITTEDTTFANINLSRQNDANLATTFRLRLGPANATALRSRETLPTFSITCTNQFTPVKTCSLNWPTQAAYIVDGYVDEFVSAAPGAATNMGLRNTHTLTFSLIDPQQVPRPGMAGRFAQAEYSASFWTAFALNQN